MMNMASDLLNTSSRFLLGLGLLVITTLALSCDSGEWPAIETADDAKVVVTVNGRPITEGDVNRRIRAMYADVDRAAADPARRQQMTRQAIEAEILDSLLLEAVEKSGLAVAPDHLDRQVERSKKLMGKDKFNKMLKERRASAAAYREFIRKRILIDEYRKSLFNGFTVDENAIKQYYEGHRERFWEPPSVRLEVVTVSDRDTASAVEKRIVAGDSLEKVDADLEIGKSGGRTVRTRWMPYEALPENLSPKIIAASKGDVITNPQKENEVLVVRILDKRPARILPFEEARDQIKDFLLQKKQQRSLNDWYAAEARKASIKYHP